MTQSTLVDTIALYDRTAASYATTWDGFVNSNLSRFVSSALPGPVADIGCGTGRDLVALSASGLSVVGVDLSRGMLAQAAKLSPAPLVCADMTALPFASGSLSGIWAAASLLHLPHSVAPAAVVELARVAQPGAPLFCSVKLGWGEGVAEDGRFFAYHSRAGFYHLLDRAGWVVEDLSVEPDSRRPDTSWVTAHAYRA